MEIVAWILSIISITGAFLVSYKRIEGFYLWLVANGGWIVYCIICHTYGQILMWSVYFATSIIGIIQWSKKT